MRLLCVPIHICVKSMCTVCLMYLCIMCIFVVYTWESASYDTKTLCLFTNIIRLLLISHFKGKILFQMLGWHGGGKSNNTASKEIMFNHILVDMYSCNHILVLGCPPTGVHNTFSLPFFSFAI